MADSAECAVRWVVEPNDGIETSQIHATTWRDSNSICALADAERHLGHIVRAGSFWLAFDATHVDESGTGFQLLGCCVSVDAAKCLVEHVIDTIPEVGRVPGDQCACD
jgi:hypothetical protein